MSYGVLPADRYQVINKTILSELDKKNLMSFYSPIIGPVAVSLYLMLWQDLKVKENDSEILIHNHLLSLLKCSSQSFKEAREALEAVGLIKTFVKEENVLSYIYELYSPLSASEFLNHPILNVVLYNNIGTDEYNLLIKENQKQKYDYTGYEEITKKMDEVYTSSNVISPDNLKERNINSIKLNSKIDYDLIISSIPKDTINDKTFNKRIRELIDNLSFVYNVDSLQMVEFIRKSLNEFGAIDKDTLRKTVSKYYQFSFNGLPTIVYRRQPEYLKNAPGDSSPRAKVVTMFENISPYDFLKSKNKGGKPTFRDLKLVENLLVDLELTPAVVNVLLDYCLRINNNKLTASYVQTVAGQWKRAGLKTAVDAMTFAEKEYKKGIKKNDQSHIKVNKTPEWFNQNIEKKEATEEEKQVLEDLLKEFK